MPNCLTRILIPYDGSPNSDNAVKFAACISKDLKPRIKNIALIHVLAGSYLSEHLENVDIRAEELLESDAIKDLKQRHVEKEIAPMLEKAVEYLKQSAPDVPVEYVVEDGRPAEKIMEFAQKGGFSTILIGRRGLSAMKEFFVGSVTINLINQPGPPSIYVLSEDPLIDGTCPIPRVLIPLDTSKHAQTALQEALMFLKSYGSQVNEVDLLRVIDPARYEEKRAQGIIPEEEGRHLLEDARQKVVASGVPENKVDTLMLYGKPSEKILELARERSVNIVFMGKRGHSPIKDLVVGSTTLDVIHRLTSAIIAIVTVDEA